jgi:hypothetical protein
VCTGASTVRGLPPEIIEHDAPRFWQERQPAWLGRCDDAARFGRAMMRRCEQ